MVGFSILESDEVKNITSVRHAMKHSFSISLLIRTALALKTVIDHVEKPSKN